MPRRSKKSQKNAQQAAVKQAKQVKLASSLPVKAVMPVKAANMKALKKNGGKSAGKIDVYDGLPIGETVVDLNIQSLILHSQLAAISTLKRNPALLLVPVNATIAAVSPAELAGYYLLCLLQILQRNGSVSTTSTLTAPTSFATDEMLIPNSLAYYIVSIMKSIKPPLWSSKLSLSQDIALTTSGINSGSTANSLEFLQEQISAGNTIFGGSVSLNTIVVAGGSVPGFGSVLVNNSLPYGTLISGPTSLCSSTTVLGNITKVLSTCNVAHVPIKKIFGLSSPDHSFLAYPVGPTATCNWTNATSVAYNGGIVDPDLSVVLTPLQNYTGASTQRNPFPPAFVDCVPMNTQYSLDTTYASGNVIGGSDNVVAQHLMLFYEIGAMSETCDWQHVSTFKKMFRVNGLYQPSKFCKITGAPVDSYELTRKILWGFLQFSRTNITGQTNLTTDMLAVVINYIQGSILAKVSNFYNWSYNKAAGAQSFFNLANMLGPVSMLATALPTFLAVPLSQLGLTAYRGCWKYPAMNLNFGNQNCGGAGSVNRAAGFFFVSNFSGFDSCAIGANTGATYFPDFPMLNNATGYNMVSGGGTQVNGVVQFGNTFTVSGAQIAAYQTNSQATNSQTTSQLLYPWFSYSQQLIVALEAICGLNNVNKRALLIQPQMNRYYGALGAFGKIAKVVNNTNQPEYDSLLCYPVPTSGIPNFTATLVNYALYHLYYTARVACAAPMTDQDAVIAVALSPYSMTYSNSVDPVFPHTVNLTFSSIIDNSVVASVLSEIVKVDGAFIENVMADQKDLHKGAGSLIVKTRGGRVATPRNCLVRALKNLASQAVSVISHPNTPLLAESACVNVNQIASYAGLSVPGGAASCQALRGFVATAGTIASQLADSFGIKKKQYSTPE